MPPIIWIDGTYHDRATGKVSVFDHGLLYGDGVFEGIRVYNRRVFRLAQHLDRLYASAKGIWLEIPLAKPALHRLVEEAVAKSGLEEAYIRLVVTRGVGDLGLDPRKCATPSVICIVDTIQLWSPERYEKGLTALTAATPISHRESLSPRIKSLNYLSHILAKVEGIAAGVDEVIMLDSQGYVAEASGMNRSEEHTSELHHSQISYAVFCLKKKKDPFFRGWTPSKDFPDPLEPLTEK